MGVPFFSDIYKLFYYLRKDPLAGTSGEKDIEGVGITSPDVWFDLRQQMFGGSGPLKIAVGEGGSDYIDMSSVTNRMSRYKEYERLESVPEIYTALNTFADEACVAGNTKIATPFGFFTIKDLTTMKDPDERFLVYCWDFQKNDYTLGWAYNPRFVKKAPIIKIGFDNGTRLFLTPDHRLLLMNGEWIAAGDLKFGSELKAFYRVPANYNLTKLKHHQFARVFTYNDGWKHERHFIDEWKRHGNLKSYERVSKVCRAINNELNIKQAGEVIGADPVQLRDWLEKEGFTTAELRWLKKRFYPSRKVIGIQMGKETEVYDLSVENHANFATDSTIAHNCQTDDNGCVYQIRCSNGEIKKEAEYVVHKLWNMDEKAWGIQRNLCKFGDQFLENIIDPDNPKRGIQKVHALPADSLYRMETVKGVLVEFQQAKEGPDYQSMTKVDIVKASVAELQQATAIRFHPDQIVHMRIGDHRKQFYPYGISTIEAARGPAHQLKLMEDAMLTYRLTRATERRVFYIDIGQLAGARAEAHIDRMKDQLRKKKVFNRKGGAQGASAVEERWHSLSPIEDFWIPTRPNSQTRIETLPGAGNLNEIDDSLYFRARLFMSLQFPKNYLTNEDPQSTRLTLSQQDTRFARLIERLQRPHAKGVQELVIRHLRMKGYPEESFRDLDVRMTVPSEWRQINRNETIEPLYNRAATMKGATLFSDFDILTKILMFEEEEAKNMVSRMVAQKWEDLKMQLIGQNPDQLGLTSAADSGQQIGTTPEGPNPLLAPDQQNQIGQQGQPPQGQEQQGIEQQQPEQQKLTGPTQQTQATAKLPEPSEDDVKKYDLAINDYSRYLDDEEIDDSESLGGF